MGLIIEIDGDFFHPMLRLFLLGIVCDQVMLKLGTDRCAPQR